MTSSTVASDGATRQHISSSESQFFIQSRERFEGVLGWLSGEEAAELSHAELEEHLQVDARELYRQLFQDHLDKRASEEERLADVVGADECRRDWAEGGHERPLASVFGEVCVRRLAYRARGHRNLCPADAGLNLPVERYSHGLRRLCATEAARGSFEEAGAAVRRATGQSIPNRQCQELARRSAADFDAFYASRRQESCCAGDVLVITCDGKGVVMREESLREGTRAQARDHKLAARLSSGEKRNRKRMAEVTCVYDVQPVPRVAEDIMPDGDPRQRSKLAPRAKNKWVRASVIEDARDSIIRMFEEACRRDSERERTWVALVDGNNHQLALLKAQAKRCGVSLNIVLDFVHVLEYLWKAAWSFHSTGNPAAELWVRERAQQILAGKAGQVAGSLRRQATKLGLNETRRAGADKCATYLTNKSDYLDYPTALAAGWPIATGVIEGACRHLVKDRMDITGARWGLDGAEAILKLRALHTNGDLDEYWAYHLAREHERVHQSRYTNNTIPSK